MLVGPCSCGAWHTESEDWVQAMLFKHNAEIIDGDQREETLPELRRAIEADRATPRSASAAGCGWSGHYWRAAKEPALPTVTPKMPYVSIDIETTGLDPETCQILEIGAVWDDWTKPIDELPVYHRLVYHKEYRGSAYALAMNANLLKQLSGQQEPWCAATRTKWPTTSPPG